MGNQQIKDDLQQVQSPDFEPSRLSAYSDKLWTFEGLSDMRYEHLTFRNGAEPDTMFQTRSRVETMEQGTVGKAEPRPFVREATYCAGFTSSERKIEQLKQEDVNILRVENDEKAVDHEKVMQCRTGVLTAKLLARHTEGKSLDDWLTHAEKSESDQTAKSVVSKLFQGALLCSPKSLETLIQHNKDYLKVLLETMLEFARHSENGALLQTEISDLSMDVKHKQLRGLLLQIIDSRQSSAELRTLAVRLLFRLGLLFKTAQDLLLVADLQAKHKIDISFELKPLLGTSEKMKKFLPPSKGGESDQYSFQDKTSNQSRITFTGTDDRTQDDDQACCDDKYFYMWSKQRGIFKGLMKDNFDWGDSTGDQNVKNDYDAVTWVVIDGKVHLRSSHVPDQPFMELDVESCKIKEDFEPWTSEDNLLNWTSKDEQSSIGDETSGFRYLRPAQMHYLDGELWVMAQYHETTWDSPVKRLVVEVYQREGRHFKRKQEIPLFKDDGSTPFVGSKKRHKDYQMRGMLFKNGSSILWYSGHTSHAFQRQNGQRFKKYHNWSTSHWVFWNPKAKLFHRGDCACYSFNYLGEFGGFDPLFQIKDVKTSIELPVVLDEIKASISNRLKETNEEEVPGEEGKEPVKKQKVRKAPVISNVRVLMGLEEPDSAHNIAEIPSAASLENIFEQVKAIIYSFVAVEANYQLQKADYHDDNPPLGDDMMQFFKSPFSVYLSRDFIDQITDDLKATLPLVNKSTPNNCDQIRLNALLNLLLATILSVGCCRMTLQSIITPQSFQNIVSLCPLLSEVSPMASAKNKKEDELTKEEIYSIVMPKMAERLAETIRTLADSMSPSAKLEKIAQGLNSSDPASVNDLCKQLAERKELKKLFSKTDGLEHVLTTVNGCCFSINQSLKKLFASSIKSKEYQSDKLTEFDHAVARLQSSLVQELCAAYGDRLYDKLHQEKQKQVASGDDAEEKKQIAQKKFEQSKQELLEFDKIIYQCFINISEHIKQQMIQLSIAIQQLDPSTTEKQLLELTKNLQALFSRDASIMRSCMFFSLFFTCYEVDVTWLDEIAEGLKHVSTAINTALLSLQSIIIDANTELAHEQDPLVIYLKEVQRFVGYTLGWVAGRLIKSQDSKSSDICKLNILQGGVENRFIPGLSEATKIQIEGSFKITGDKELQQLSLKEADQVELSSEDKMLRAVIQNDASVKLTLEVLHQSLLQKVPMCLFARLGGDQGAEISRAAFAVILKFSDLIMDFQALNNQVEKAAADVSSSGTQKLKEIIMALKEQKSSEYEGLFKRWEFASQMRKWTQQVKLSIGDRTAKEAEEAFRQEWNEAHPSEEPLTGPLNDEQKQKVEEKSSAKFTEDLNKAYSSVVKKAEILITLQVPNSFKENRKAKGILSALQSQMSLNFKQELFKRKTTIKIESDISKKDTEFDWTDRLKAWKKVQMAEGAILDFTSTKQMNSGSASMAILGLLQSEFSVDDVKSAIEDGLVSGLRRSAGINLLNYAMGLQGNSRMFFDMLQWFSGSLRQNKQTSMHFLDGLSCVGNSCEKGIRSQFFGILSKVVLRLKTSIDHTEHKLLLNALCWNFKAEDHEELSKLGVFELLSKGDGSKLNWVRYYQGVYKKQQYAGYHSSNSLDSLNLGRVLQQTSEYLQNQVLAGTLATEKKNDKIESNQSQQAMVRQQSTLDSSSAQTVFAQMTSLVWFNLLRSLKINRMTPVTECDEAEQYNSRFSGDQDFMESQYQEINMERTVYADCKMDNPEIKTLNEHEKAMKEFKKEEDLKLRRLLQKIRHEHRTTGVKGLLESWLKDRAGPVLGRRNIGQIIDFVQSRDLRIIELLQRTSREELGLEPEAEKEKPEKESEEEKKDEPEEEKKSEPENEEEQKAENAEETKEEAPEKTPEEKLSELANQVSKLVHVDDHEKITIGHSNYGAFFYWAPQFRILMQLDQLISIAETNPLVNSLLSDTLTPDNLACLMELACQAHPIVQQLTQRILQSLLRMNLPAELFDAAVAASCKTDSRGAPSRLSQVLALENVLAFPESQFLQMQCNLLQEFCSKLQKFDQCQENLSWTAAVEVARTLRVFQTCPEKNQSMGQMFKAQLKKAFLSVETLTDAQADLIFFITSETRPMFEWSAGQVVKMPDGVRCVIVDSSLYHRNVLYCDKDKPESQQLIVTSPSENTNEYSPYKFQTLLDLRDEDTATAAKNSVLVEPEVIDKLLEVVRESESKAIGQLSPMTSRIVESGITRGFKNMFEALKLDYMTILQESNSLEKMISYLVKVSGKSSLPFDQWLRNCQYLDMQVLSMRQLILGYVDYYHRWQIPSTMIINEERTSCLITKQHLYVDEKTKKAATRLHLDSVAISKIVHSSDSDILSDGHNSLVRVTPGMYSLFDRFYRQRANEKFLMLSSAEIKELSYNTIAQFMHKAIITDDEVPIEELLQSVVDSLENDQSLQSAAPRARAKPSAFVVLKKADFDRISRWVSDDVISGRPQTVESDDLRVKFINRLSKIMASKSKQDDEPQVYSDHIMHVSQAIIKLNDELTFEKIREAALEAESMTDELSEAIKAVQEGVEQEVKVEEEEEKKVEVDRDQPLPEVPNFTDLVLAEEENLEKIGQNFENRADDQKLEFHEYGTAKDAYQSSKEMWLVSADSDRLAKVSLKLFNSLKVLNESLCRTVLISILDSAGKHLQESTRQLLDQREMTTRLDDLVHNNHMVNAFHAISFDISQIQEESAAQITNVLRLFAQSDTIKEFLVNDFFKRAKETVERSMPEDDKSKLFNDETGLKQGWRDVLKLEEILDPTNVLLLPRQFIEQNYIPEAKLAETLVGFFELSLIYASWFLKDKVSMLKDSLLNETKYFVQNMQQKASIFQGKSDLLNRVLSNKILKTMLQKVDMGKAKQIKSFSSVFEIAFQLQSLSEEASQALDENFKVDLELPDSMSKIFEHIRSLKDGHSFSSRMNQIKFDTLLSNKDSQLSGLAECYGTAENRFTANFKKTFGPKEEDWTFKLLKHTSPGFIQVKIDDGSQIMADSDGLVAGSSEIQCKAGQTMTIEFPVKPQIVKVFGMMKSLSAPEPLIKSQDSYTAMNETAVFSPVQIFGTANCLTFVAADGTVWGMGANIQHATDQLSEKLRKLDFPEGLNPSDIKKVHVSKLAREIWTKDNRFFHQGKHKTYHWGPNHTYTEAKDLEQFQEMDKDWFRNKDDKIVDWVCGKHFNAVITESGKVICSSYYFYRRWDSDIRHNDENNEDYAFTVKPPQENAKAIQIFPCYDRFCIFVNFDLGGGKIRTFAGGDREHDDLGSHGKFHELELPDGRYFKKVSSNYQQIFAIDDQNNLWFWAKSSDIDICFPKADGEDDCLATRHSDKPNLFKWFKDKNLKVLDVRTGLNMAVISTQDSNGKREFYGLGQQMNDYNVNYETIFVNRFNQGTKALYGTCIHVYTEITPEKVADYALTKNVIAFIMKGETKKPVSIVPSKPDATGLIHFFKQGEKWEFVTEDEYEAKKNEIPQLSFASRHPIADFSQKTFADLNELQSGLEFEGEGEPTYYSRYTSGNSEDEKAKEVSATEKEALEGGQTFDLDPVIFIRSARPLKKACEGLPTLKLSDYFQHPSDKEEGLEFAILKSNITEQEINALEVREEKQKQFISDLKSFTKAQDSQLMEQIDKIAKKRSCEATAIKSSSLSKEDFTWSGESALARMSESLIKNRVSLLIDLLKAWNAVEKVTNLSNKDVKGTLANLVFSMKNIVPASILDKIVDQAVETIGAGYGSEVQVSRRKAMVFADQGKIDHEGKYSLYGQIIQQLKDMHSDMSNFRQKSVDEKCYSIKFKGEGSIDAGGPFRESLSNICQEFEKGVVPIFIPTPNNKNEHGAYRECFMLNPSSKTPSHKFMMKYFGGFLAFAFMSKSPLPFNLAPWFWKQVIGEEVTMNDLEAIDAYSAQVLKDLQNYSKILSAEDFEMGVDQCFTTVLSSGEEVPLCEGGETRKVTKANVEEFCQAVLATRAAEAKEQVEAVREGFLRVIDNKSEILDFMSWSSFDARCTGDKTVDLERLKSITSFPRNDNNHRIVGRFWRVFESFNDQERTNYLKFVWGRQRLPVDLKYLSYKHEVRLESSMNNQSFPQAHTCFFQLDVPDYETDEDMRNKIKVACELCGEMDTDGAAGEDLD